MAQAVRSQTLEAVALAEQVMQMVDHEKSGRSLNPEEEREAEKLRQLQLHLKQKMSNGAPKDASAQDIEPIVSRALFPVCTATARARIRHELMVKC